MQFPWGPPSLRLEDLLLNRMMELVVHLDDLAISIRADTPALPAAATDTVIQLLATLAARRRGPGSLIRALTRTERAPASITAF